MVFSVACAAHAPVAAAEQLAVARAQYREVALAWSADGVVEAARQSTVSAQIAGRVKEILFDAGDVVRKGQVILRIDEREAARAVAGSQAQVMRAQAALQNAESAYGRARQLHAQKFISQAALDKAQADYRMALAQAAASEAGAGQSALVQGYTAVVAPYGGVVAARLVEVGEMVTVGKPLMTGFDPSQMRAIVHVPQQRLAEIGSSPDATVSIPPSAREIKAASVTVQPAADARTHSTPVRVYFPSGESGIYPGMSVRIHFAAGKAGKLLIPSGAVLRRSEVVAVYVVDDSGAVKLRQVRLGEAAGQGEIEVLAGLNPGEQVALDPVKAGMSQQAK
ncbi:MAG: efflux RND transporter periplasmic adaptor subunit [Nitrosomonadales bacterium]|nr:efflux RND transporter periplasmic adaptor subunit [Nitrosomonadales bacterium]